MKLWVCLNLGMAEKNSIKYFKTPLAVIRLAVMYYVRYPMIFCQVEDILYERGTDIYHKRYVSGSGYLDQKLHRKSAGNEYVTTQTGNVS